MLHTLQDVPYYSYPHLITKVMHWKSVFKYLHLSFKATETYGIVHFFAMSIYVIYVTEFATYNKQLGLKSHFYLSSILDK